MFLAYWANFRKFFLFGYIWFGFCLFASCLGVLRFGKYYYVKESKSRDFLLI